MNKKRFIWIIVALFSMLGVGSLFVLQAIQQRNKVAQEVHQIASAELRNQMSEAFKASAIQPRFEHAASISGTTTTLRPHIQQQKSGRTCRPGNRPNPARKCGTK